MERVRAVLAALTICVASAAFAPFAMAQTCVDHACPPVHGREKSHFIKGTTVSVYINSAFGFDQRSAIMQAFNTWSSNSGNATGINFVFDDGPAPVGEHATLSVDPKDLSDGTMGFFRYNPVLNSGYMDISTEVVSPLGVGNVTAHEIGHALGLDDCTGCCPGTSVMAYPGKQDTLNTAAEKGLSGPTDCDMRQANERVDADLPKETVEGVPVQDKRELSMESDTCYEYWLVVYIDYPIFGRVILSRTYLGTDCFW